MSFASPQNREELKAYIKTKLGAPVLEINVSDEQIDLAINDAFQYFYERQHFDASEQVYLSVRLEQPFIDFMRTGELEDVTQNNTQLRYADGMVDTLTITSAGTAYPPSSGKQTTLTDVATTGGTGTGLTVNVSEERTTDGGLVSVTVFSTGTGYQVGDVVTIDAGGKDATFTVATVKTSSPLHGTDTIKTQNNYIVLPDSVIGVRRILRSSGYSNIAGGVLPGVALFNPFIAGGMSGSGQIGNMNYDLTSYYTMQQYMSTLNWMIYPPLSYTFNKRTHRLFISSDSFNGSGAGDYITFECDVKADPDMFPDVWNDMFLKKLATAYTQLAWGRNMTKFKGVPLPGGLTMNGEQILQDAKDEISNIQERFMLDYGDYALDIVG